MIKIVSIPITELHPRVTAIPLVSIIALHFIVASLFLFDANFKELIFSKNSIIIMIDSINLRIPGDFLC